MAKGKKISAEDLNRLRLLFDKYKTEDDKIHEEGLAKLLKDEGSVDPVNDARDLIAAIDVNSDGVVSIIHKERGDNVKEERKLEERRGGMSVGREDKLLTQLGILWRVSEIILSEHCHSVEFSYHAPHYVHEVKIAGPWNHWHGEAMHAKGNNVYALTVKLPEGRTHYKYIQKVGDHWRWDVDHSKATEHCPDNHINNYIDVKNHY